MAKRTRDGTAPPAKRARKSKSGPRTASGKKANLATLASAEQGALEGLKERTEEGHIKAGRTPPSQTGEGRSAGAKRLIDDAIRDNYFTITEDEKLLQQPGPRADFTRSDPWRVMRIQSEFI